jgi:site-specific recombinase XerD
MFIVDNQIKESFLATKPTATAQSNSRTMALLDEYEQLVNKKSYNLTHAEIQEMISIKFKNSSMGTISKNISIIRKYVDFCIEKGLVSHMENRFDLFTSSDVLDMVSKKAVKNRYISKETIQGYINDLHNDQDKLLIELVTQGVRGRTQKDATLEELINLTIDKVDRKKGIITLVKNNGEERDLEVSDSTIQLIEDVYNQEIYYSNNGESTETKYRNGSQQLIRELKINHVERYVFRVPGATKQSLFTPTLLGSRMARIQKYVGNRYLTFNSLYMSGMINLAKDILSEKGEITKQDYINICDRFQYGETPEKYYLNVKYLVELYLSLEGKS